ncbi:hypothetical protein BMF94_5888 [Rhodotorula taiwanensis]|uniref:D-lactate dehydrogenase (cytochrome) n=1 Tax=Rhodotorula taiwanensis TaxID=741276 RepID=A0A2S5B359_9BASI|nr:hypothetical protein BMF94_5888 [Rhodotorula taiwanensis]
MSAAKERVAAVGRHLLPVPRPAAPSPDWTGAEADLRAAFPASQLSFDLETRDKHGQSFGSLLPSSPPAAIVHAESTEDVVRLVTICTTRGIVLIPTGGRTALEGQFQATCCNPTPAGERGSAFRAQAGAATSLPRRVERPTVHVSLSRMQRITLFEQDFQAIVGPGVGWKSLNEHLAESGVKLFFPVDPAPGSEFGGMAGVAGSGTNAVGYGTLRAEWIQSMTVVLMDGTIVRTKGANRARKSTTGFDTGRLFLGSEGTLGIITELTVRLAPVLPLKVALTSFPTVAQAVSTVVAMLSAGLTPTSLELLDGTSIHGLNLAKLLPAPLPEEPTILMRFSNPDENANYANLEVVRRLVEQNGGRELQVARNEEENEQLWTARKARDHGALCAVCQNKLTERLPRYLQSQYWSQQLLVGEGCRTLITDVCVPVSRLAEFVSRSDVLVADSGLVAPIVAHVGDGNVHRAILWKGSPGETEPPKPVERLAKQLVELAQELEGTLTKRKYLQAELGDGTLALMRTVKRALDPLNLLNPGKVLFDEDGDD